LHTSQMKGLSPVWMHPCATRLPLVEKHLWHISHLWTFFPFVWSHCIAPCSMTLVSHSNCFIAKTTELSLSSQCVPSTRSWLIPPSVTCSCWLSRRRPPSAALLPSAPGTWSRRSPLLKKTDCTSAMQKHKQSLQSCYKYHKWKITHCTPEGGPMVVQSKTRQVIRSKMVFHVA
jgi:hypothetical protein